MTIRELQQETARVNEANGWVVPPFNDAYGMLAKLMLVVTELSESAEDVRNGEREHFREELADAVIRIMHIAESERFDLEDEICKKLKHNTTRGYRHGGKRA